MAKYRKKPIVLEATQWHSHGDHPAVVGHRGNNLCGYCGERVKYTHGWVVTLEGGHRVCPGDWIMTGTRGEHWPVKPDIFEETYELVE